MRVRSEYEVLREAGFSAEWKTGSRRPLDGRFVGAIVCLRELSSRNRSVA